MSFIFLENNEINEAGIPRVFNILKLNTNEAVHVIYYHKSNKWKPELSNVTAVFRNYVKAGVSHIC